VIGFRGYAQRDPLNEYKSEAFELFQAMLAQLRQVVTSQLMRVELVREAAQAPALQAPPGEGHHIDPFTGEDDFGDGETAVLAAISGRSDGERDPENPASWGDVGRNEPCPCGSGKKFKHCHGAFA
jgi:preprotein translocase subunit SecA